VRRISKIAKNFPHSGPHYKKKLRGYLQNIEKSLDINSSLGRGLATPDLKSAICSMPPSVKIKYFLFISVSKFFYELCSAANWTLSRNIILSFFSDAIM
jgi:hypothetical protein